MKSINGMVKRFKITFVTILGRTLVKTVRALDYETAHKKLDMKYNIAYFLECNEELKGGHNMWRNHLKN